ncbi:MAG: hypothetical protein HKO01_01215 [Flaviramulus sp.]|nr:hypothetical protein [Flaviramulus sp.]NNC49139.1 hypothetical protein [Flaviramulus sp.]
MRTIQTHTRYVKWLSPEEMHNESQEWLSELRFMKDEHLFFEDLVKSYTLQLISPEKFSHNAEIIEAINKSRKKNGLLIKAIIVHINNLKIMVDGIDQIEEEEAYKKEHRRLTLENSDQLRKYRILKTQLFDIIKNIKKEEKHPLIDKE